MGLTQRSLAFLVMVFLGVSSFPQVIFAQDLHAIARISAAQTRVESKTNTLMIELGLSHAVPFRVFTLDKPTRLVLDFQEVDWAGADLSALRNSFWVGDLRFGAFRPSWSRLVMDLKTPMQIETIEMRTGSKVVLAVLARKTDAETFAQSAGAPASGNVSGIWAHATEPPVISGAGHLRVAIDAGHGGIDPGAVRDGIAEKDIVFEFAAQLHELLLKSGDFSVFLTRKRDIYVGLSDRVRRAQEADADVFLSIHVNTVAEGTATGATVYSLSEKASDAAAQKLAELENRSDIAAGLDLKAEDDEIALVLIDLARVETNARSKHFAEALVASMAETVGTIRNRPHKSAGFRVLKAPDMPSLLLELGFMSNPKDRANMENPKWRLQAAKAVLSALQHWSAEDKILQKMILK